MRWTARSSWRRILCSRSSNPRPSLSFSRTISEVCHIVLRASGGWHPAGACICLALIQIDSPSTREPQNIGCNLAADDRSTVGCFESNDIWLRERLNEKRKGAQKVTCKAKSFVAILMLEARAYCSTRGRNSSSYFLTYSMHNTVAVEVVIVSSTSFIGS